MVLVGEGDGVDCSRLGGGIGEDLGVTLCETLPFEVGWDSLGCSEHIGIEVLIALGLATDELVE